MRQFDNWNVYFVQGKPFFGRFTFYKLHTTEKVEITDEEGTPLDNPILSDTYGRTSQQVFLPDEDVTVKLETYIGNGDMNDSMGHDIDNISAWAEAYTFDSLKNSLVLDISEGAVVGTLFATMNDLRLADYEHCNYALLTGYYEAGDMPPQFYVLQEDVTTPDNGGSVVRINSRYIWRMVPKESIDVRSFGVFPSDSINNLRETFQSQWQHCFNYANTMGLNVYAPKVYDSDSYYQVVGGNFNLNQIMHVDSGAHIVAKPNTTTTFNLKEIEYFGNELFLSNTTTPIITGMITVNVNTARTSWKSHSWANWPGTVSNFIVDTLDTSFSFTNARVEFEKTIENKVLSFTNCEITSNKRMKNCTASFTNCGYISDLWLDGTYTIGSLSGNIIELSEMSSANVYVNWKNKQNEANYGDLGEQTISNVALLSGAVAENAYFTNVNLMGSAELHNISGTVSISADSAQNWIDCWLTITNAATVPSFALRRGKVSGASTMVVHFGGVYLENVEQDIPLDVRGGNLTILNSSIDKPISHVGSPVVEKIMNCTFNSRISITGGAPNTIVNSTWVNNFGNVDRPIYIDRSNLNPVDLAHTYRYENNSGTFYPSKEVEWSETLTYTKPTTADPYTISSTNGRFALGIPNGSADFKNIFFATYKFADPTTQLQYAPPHGFATKVKLFRVGTDSCNAIVTWNVVSSMFNGSTWGRCLETVIPIVAQMRFVHDSNDDYHVYIREDGSFSQGGNNYYTYPFALWRLSAEADWTGLTITGKFLARKL